MTVDREHLLDEAARLLTRRPTASMDDIARAVGISRATLHRQFAGRDALVRALEELGIRRLTAVLDAVDVDGAGGGVDGAEGRADGPDEAENPEQVVRRLIAEVQPLAPFLGFLITENQLFEPGAMSPGWRRLDERIGALFRRGQEEGVFRIDLSDAWLTEAFYALVTASAWAVQDGRVAARDRARLPAELLLGGALRRGTGSVTASDTGSGIGSASRTDRGRHR